MLTAIKGTRLAESPWNEFSFDTVLAYYDGPRMLLQRGKSGEPYWLAGTTRTMQWNAGSAYPSDRIAFAQSFPAERISGRP